MLFESGRVVVAFDAAGLSGGVVSRGLRGRRLRRWARVPLEPGNLRPGPVERNLPGSEAVVRALASLRAELGLNGRRRGATLLLPDAPARLQLVETPPGATASEFARFRVGPTLPYPASEAQLAVLPLGGGRSLAAAVRRGVVVEYERAAAEAGFEQRELSLASYAALPRLLQTGHEPRVAAILGDHSVALAVITASGLEVFRSRLRDHTDDQADRLWAEAERSAGMAGLATFSLTVVGAGASGLVSSLQATGRPARRGWEGNLPGSEAARSDLAWLGLG